MLVGDKNLWASEKFRLIFVLLTPQYPDSRFSKQPDATAYEKTLWRGSILVISSPVLFQALTLYSLYTPVNTIPSY